MPVYQAAQLPDPTVLTGQRTITGIVAQRIIPQIEDKILFRRPNKSPFVAFSKTVRGSKTVPNRLFGWLTRDEYPRLSAVADATVTAVGGTLNVTPGTGTRFYNSALVLNSTTGEVFRVSNVVTDQLTIQRICNGQIMLQGQTLVILGSAYVSGAVAGTLKSLVDVYDQTYTHIVRTPWGFDRRQAHTELYGGRDPAIEKADHTTKHAMDLEYVALFSRQSNTIDASGAEITTTRGFFEAVEPYSVWDLEGTRPTLQDFNQVLEYAMAEGDGGYISSKGDAMKYFMYGPAWGTLIDSWWMNNLHFENDVSNKGIGFKVGFVETGHGRLGLLRQPLFVGPFAGLAAIVDFNHIELRFHEGGQTALHEHIELPGTDGEAHEFLTDFGLKTEASFRQHTIMKNLGAAA
jgi:hypothetical protein